jgi:hypothetical protein
LTTKLVDEAQTVAQTTILDRMLIANSVKEIKIYETWVTATRAPEKEMFFMPLAEQYAVINSKIVDAATKDL